ncbi:NYN domain-containing protein [Patescibacteria group bacterium]
MKINIIQKGNNYAFLDSQNLNLGILELGWKLDFKRFRIYLQEKYNVNKAYLFIGYINKNRCLYKILRSYGYILIFKPTVIGKEKIKGNVDGELILQAMIDFNKYDKAIIISGDGDFYCLVKYLYEQNKILRIFVPNKYKYSVLLRKAIPSGKKISFMNDFRKLLELKKVK